ncbi:receptor-like protein 43 [Salvia hispanica]|uniref:receptor-like protein 43 n=1 Tax=Salvia hispanica TaxID=49212 RepID=UPI002009930A|nr:receptor-like protein 43 [Salvia hispanica]
MEYLDLSNNQFNGQIKEFPIENQSTLFWLDLSGNRIGGPIPNFFFQLPNLFFLWLSDNLFNDTFQLNKIRTLTILSMLSLSNNNLSVDTTNVSSSSHGYPNLQVLQMSLCNLYDFPDLRNASYLSNLDLSNNRLRGDIPSWIWEIKEIYLDLSFNLLTGLKKLPISPNFSDSIILLANNQLTPTNEVTLTVKGIEVWPDFTSVDMSSNRFEVEIQGAIGNLSSLYLLNLSHNSLSDAIPRSLGALTELGSLDLSENMLTGTIPWELTKLSFLSILNVSYNDLKGMIPTGRQFQTFSADLFEGNAGLCGFPLNKSFSSPHEPGSTPYESKDEEIEWEYVFVASVYVVGIGSVAWTLLFCRRLRERYFLEDRRGC